MCMTNNKKVRISKYILTYSNRTKTILRESQIKTTRAIRGVTVGEKMETSG